MIQRKYANVPGWKRILQHRYYGSYLDTPEFKGHIAQYCMDAVAAPPMERIAKRQFGLLALTGAQREMLLQR